MKSVMYYIYKYTEYILRALFEAISYKFIYLLIIFLDFVFVLQQISLKIEAKYL